MTRDPLSIVVAVPMQPGGLATLATTHTIYPPAPPMIAVGNGGPETAYDLEPLRDIVRPVARGNRHERRAAAARARR